MNESQARAAYDAIKQTMADKLGQPDLATSMETQRLSDAAKLADMSDEFEAVRTAWWNSQCAASGDTEQATHVTELEVEHIELSEGVMAESLDTMVADLEEAAAQGDWEHVKEQAEAIAILAASNISLSLSHLNTRGIDVDIRRVF